MNFMKRWADAVDKRAELAMRVFMMATIENLLYAILPVLVIALITRLLNRGFEHFLLLKEWSFASIVLFGAAIQKFVRFKNSVQRQPRSWKSQTGIQVFIAPLIGSVLVLAVVILLEMGIVPPSASDFIAVAQLTFFSLAIFAVLVPVWFIESFNDRLDELPQDLPRDWVMGRLKGDGEDASSDLLYVVYAMEKLSSHAYRRGSDAIWDQLHEQQAAVQLENAVTRLGGIVDRLRRQTATLIHAEPRATEADKSAASSA